MESEMDAARRPSSEGVVADLAGLAALAGVELGPTEWREMTQDRVDAFAHVTEDHNFIHVDPARASETPFGGTIAHGYLTLSLLAPITQQLLSVSDAAVGINYGLDRVRFTAARSSAAPPPSARSARSTVASRSRCWRASRSPSSRSRRSSPNASFGTTHERAAATRRPRGDRHRKRARPRPGLRPGAGRRWRRGRGQRRRRQRG